MLEPIMGVGSGTSGKCSFDPANPKSFSGQITLDAKSLHVPNKGMKDTMHGSDWLDVNAHPTITFNIKEVKEVATKGDVHELTVAGELTCKGVTKPLTTKVTATYLPEKLQERGGKAKGDLLALRSSFVIKRADFNIKPDMGGEVVAEDIEIRVSIVGSHKAG
jgi:polyisoprenoid-binding protein YceI